MTTYTTPGAHTYTVGAGVSSVLIEVWGADGGGTNGGTGGYAKGALAVSGGETLNVHVGGQDSTNGGGNGGDDQGGPSGADGGGGTDVRQGGDLLGDRVIVAGGGGGQSNASNGGAGGASTGAAGDSNDSAPGAGGGGGGTQTAGGSGGTGYTDYGDDGSLGQGGAGGVDQSFQGAGGGGGGGYYGGGGGGNTDGSTHQAGGGGGGSNYVGGVTDTTSSRGVSASNAGDGKVIIVANEPPASPTLSVDSFTGTSVSLSWTTDNNEDGFRVYRAEASGTTAADYTQIADLAAGTTTYTDDAGGARLENGERYYYRVEAYNSVGTSLSNEVAQTTSLPAPTLSADTGLDASVEDEITVTWDKADDSPDGNYEVYRSEASGTLGSVVATISALSTTSYTDTGLEDGEEYHYTVRRNTDHTSADSKQRKAITVLPGASNTTVTST